MDTPTHAAAALLATLTEILYMVMLWLKGHLKEPTDERMSTDVLL